jgi:hypothetical protein
MPGMLEGFSEGEVRLGEQEGETEREVPHGKEEPEVNQGEAEGKVPLGEQEQEPLAAYSDHGLSYILSWQRSGHNLLMQMQKRSKI